ncbi:MAG: ammonium transporter [Hyphomicrobiaceae bacterium]|nr:ammonium transporter [Hyphomicrobiaceae bacterium]
MTERTPRRLAVMAVAALLTCVASAAALAADAPTPNKGDTAWMLTASALVLVMTVPGLALFYGGLVRTKNMLSMLMQVFYTLCVVCILWVLFGYSLAFTEGGAFNAYVGGLSKAFLAGVTADSTVETFTDGVVIPELAYIAFQMTFAAITPALIVGALAERMKFSAIALFIPLWATLVYFPIAHMVWYWAGPGATIAAAKALAAAAADAKAAAQIEVDKVAANAGLIFQWGAIDFAGGTVVHINAGIAGLVGCLVLGKRVGYGREAMPPHSLTMCLIGAGLLWFGWFGFNAGSALEAGGTAALAMVNTFVATAAAALAWLFVEFLLKGKPSLLGGASGAVAGLVAVTPAAGFAGPMGAVVLGLVAGVVCLIFVDKIKNAFGYDDALDVFGVHCIGGITGAIGTAIVAAPAFGGTGIFDYAAGKVGDYNMTAQLVNQAYAVGLTLLWSGVVTLVLLILVKLIVGLRPGIDQEREGLDLVDHGERAYNY